MSKAEVIIKRRGAFLWLPVLCSNDLVHGSWYFVARFETFHITVIHLSSQSPQVVHLGFAPHDAFFILSFDQQLCGPLSPRG